MIVTLIYLFICLIAYSVRVDYTILTITAIIDIVFLISTMVNGDVKCEIKMKE